MRKNLSVLSLVMPGLFLFSGCAAVDTAQNRVELNTEGLVKGVFSLGPAEEGLVETELSKGECPNGQSARIKSGDFGLCNLGQMYESMDSTWVNPDVVGVYVRIPWDEIHVAPGAKSQSFDFTILDHEFEQAVKYGKFVSLSFSAGQDDIPTWLFKEGGVEALEFQDGGSQLEPGQCGSRMTLGDPTDDKYQQHYFEMIRGVGEYINSLPEWRERLAYFKISGANLYSHEFRLPNNCDPACDICNTEVWAKAGYTPDGIYAFVLNQMDVIQEVFPGTPMVYQLIQDGLPWINNQGDYLQADGTSSGAPVTRSVEQVEEIIRLGSEQYGPLFVVAHNGLGPTGKPNRWVTKAGKDGQPTGFQTRNLSDIYTTAQLQDTFENLWDNSTGHYLEVYEQLIWLAAQNDNQLVPENKSEINTLGEWTDLLQTR